MKQVLIVRCDGVAPRKFITSGGKPSLVMFNEDGVPGYLLDEDVAGQLCAGNPDRYRPYKSGPLSVMVKGKWVTFYPWTCGKVTRETGKLDDNGEAITEKVLEWVEDKNCISVVPNPTAETFTGRTPEVAGKSFDQQVELRQALAKAQKALDKLEELEKRIIALEEIITANEVLDDLVGETEVPAAEKPAAEKPAQGKQGKK